MIPSSISKINLDGRSFYVKRDDLIDPYLAGNKYRKLYTLLQTLSRKYHTIISYGGTQSNAMLAIAAICNKKSWKFIYYSKPVNMMEEDGNLFAAKALGMIHKEIEYDYYKEFIASLSITLNEKTLLLDQGGADSLAKEGLEVLAKEIEEEDLDTKSIAIPSGTGTTALYLALALPKYKIYTVACVGNTEYLRRQMEALHAIPDNLLILQASRKYHFAKPYQEFLSLYKRLLKEGIEFDLLYAPLMWQTLLEYKMDNILYIHSGGISGNKTMLKRYLNKKIS